MANPSDDDHPTGFSQEDFLQVFTEHSRQIYRFILTLTANRPDADDLYQITSLILYKKFNEFDPSIGSFYSWACRIAYLQVLNQRRSRKRANMLSDEVIELLQAEMEFHSQANDPREDALEDCLKKLPSKEFELVKDRYYRDLPPKKIAELQGRSIHAIYRALVKVHVLLRNCVDRTLTAET